jgi:Fe-S-cluster-containing hydrogenase component 2
MSKALLYDATMCIGCKQCEQACAQQNKLPYDDTVAAESVQSEHKYTVVLTKDDKFMRRLCVHCEHPACASACPVGGAGSRSCMNRTSSSHRKAFPMARARLLKTWSALISCAWSRNAEAIRAMPR